MGGNALKDVGVARLPAHLYTRLAGQVVARLTDGNLFPGMRACVIPAIRAKSDFGDLDVLVTHQEPRWGFDEARQAVLATAFQPTRLVPNGPVLSFDVAVPDDPETPDPGYAGARFQVDLIRVDPEVFLFAFGYFSYNDLGNLLGRVARLHGFKLGHDGLFRPLRAPGNEWHFVRDILVTRNWSRALQFLGYDPARWERGFDTMEEMFTFVTDSRAFHPTAFPLEHRSHRARVRDRKRPTYTAFLQHLTDRGLVPAAEIRENRLAMMRKMGLARALDQFGFEDFARDWQQAHRDLRDALRFRQRFNGDAVRRMTGLDGAALGQHMRALRAQFSSEEALRSFVLGASDEGLAAFVVRRFESDGRMIPKGKT